MHCVGLGKIQEDLMDIQTLRTFFMCCTILNGSLLVASFIICASAGDWVYRMHSKWFPIPRDAFNVVIYSFIGIFKISVLVLNLIPYIVLGIVG
jgi:hypothetical protein